MTGWVRIVGPLSTDNELPKSMSATCPNGTKAIGGGFELDNVSDRSAVLVESSEPSADGSSWHVTADVDTTDGDASFSIRALVACVSAN